MILGIKKSFTDRYGIIHADGFWKVTDINCSVGAPRGMYPAAGHTPGINVVFVPYHDQAACEAGSQALPEEQRLAISTIEQFPSIAAWADLTDYAYQVAKNHPTQTYFNDGVLVESV